MAVISGTDGNDVITGTGSSDYIYGNGGNDTLTSAGSSSRLYGGSGHDKLKGSGSNNYLYGEDGDDRLIAGGSNNYLYGGSGDDRLVLGAYDDAYLSGSYGDDTYVINWSSATSTNALSATINEEGSYYTQYDDTLDLSSFVDDASQLSFSGASYYGLVITINDDNGNAIGSITIESQFLRSYDRGIESLVLGNETIAIGDFDNADELNSINLYGASVGDDSIVGTDEDQAIYGLGGDDTIVSGGANSEIFGGAGNDVLTGTGEANLLDGGAGNDSLTAGGDDTSLKGANGDDALVSGDFSGLYLEGSYGDDVYRITWDSAAADNAFTATIHEGLDYYDGRGHDTLDLSDVATSLDNLSFGSGYYWSDLKIYVKDDQGNLIGTITIDDQYDFYGDDDLTPIDTLIVGDDTVDLTAYSDVGELVSVLVYGASSFDDVITGTTDDESISGFAGDDTLTSGGDDTYLWGDEGNDRLTGGGSSNSLIGGAGDDTLISGDYTGAYMSGGDGDDLYIINWTSTTADNPFTASIGHYYTRGGDDTLDLSAVAGSLDDLDFGGTTSLVIYVKDDDGDTVGTITIDYEFDTYSSGSLPVDTLVVGDDTLALGDFASGGELASQYDYGASDADDDISTDADYLYLYGFGGDDVLSVSGNYSRAYGGDGDDTLDSSVSNGYLYGDNDNDVLRASGSYARLDGGAGDDTLSATGAGSYLYGRAGSDLLTAGAANIYLYGEDGNDTLTSGDFSNGQLSGGAGNDTFIVNWTSATTTSNLYTYVQDSGGSDTLDISALADTVDDIDFSGTTSLTIYINDANGNHIGSVTVYDQYNSYSTGSQVETLVLGDETIDLTQYGSAAELSSIYEYGATAGDDEITLSTPYQYLYGLDGNDTLTTSGSGSRLYGGNGDDVLSSSASSTYLFGEDGDDRLSSSGSSSTLLGGTGNDTLSAESQYDYLYGGLGDDTYAIEWLHASSSNRAVTNISESEYVSDGGSDTLDLSAVAADFGSIAFSDYYYYGSLVITVHDDNGNVIGTVYLNNQNSTSSYDRRIETLTIDGETFDLTLGNTAAELTALLVDNIASLADTLNGTDADETLSGENGEDVISGGGGDDRILGGRHDDRLDGGSGNDFLRGDQGADTVYGGDGDDSIWAGASDDGNDVLYGEDGDDIISGGAGDDVAYGGAGTDTIFGGSGNDTLFGNVTPEDEDGDLGSDIIWSGSGTDKLYGGAGNDSLGGGLDSDWITGFLGNDLIYGGGGYGADTLFGDGGHDTLYGGLGNDLLDGGAGNDLIFNGGGNDLVDGGKGDDTLWGGGGDDTLTGGAGADTFAFNLTGGTDTVSDFNAGQDFLNLAECGFADLAALKAATTSLGGDLYISAGSATIILLDTALGDLTDSNVII